MIRTLSAVLGLMLASGAVADEKDFKPLINGKDLTGWMNATGDAPGAGWKVENGVLARTERAGDIWTKERYGDFVLELEFDTTGNSGVFFRTDNPKNNVQTGIEVQVDKPAAKPSRHSVGSIYDLVAPTTSATKAGDWNSMRIVAEGPHLTVFLNNEQVAKMNLDEWDTPGQNPDGSKNKFRTALKDFKREGHIGFQDHGANVRYRNVRIKSLDASKSD